MNNLEFALEMKNKRLASGLSQGGLASAVLERQRFVFFWCYFFCIAQTRTVLLDEITPWKQMLYARRLILIVRHIQQHHV